MTRDTFDMFAKPDRGRFGECGNDAVTGNDSVRSNLCDIDSVVHHGTDKALLVSIDGREAKAVWLARSRIETEHKTTRVEGERRDGRTREFATATVTLPSGLAKEKGLI